MLQGLTMEGNTGKERQGTEFQDLIKKPSTFKDLNRIQGLFKTTTKTQVLSNIVRATLKQHDPLNMDTRGSSIKHFHIKGVQLG